MKKISLYPGTFDPITNGHYDIIERASKLFDEVIIAVADSSEKKPMFDLKQRVEMVEIATSELKNIKVAPFSNLTVDFAAKENANILVRGLRTVGDFEYELQLGYLNHTLNEEIETVYLMPSLEHAFVSSSIIRNLLKFNGKTSHLLPPKVEKMVQEINTCIS